MLHEVVHAVEPQDPPEEQDDEGRAPEVIGPPDNPEAPEVEF
jgi:hypothetical protein